VPTAPCRIATVVGAAKHCRWEKEGRGSRHPLKAITQKNGLPVQPIINRLQSVPHAAWAVFKTLSMRRKASSSVCMLHANDKRMWPGAPKPLPGTTATPP